MFDADLLVSELSRIGNVMVVLLSSVLRLSWYSKVVRVTSRKIELN